MSAPTPPARAFCFFVKVYMPRDAMDAFLAERVAPWVSAALREGFDDFFFIRYADPGQHLRLRLFGGRAAVCGEPRRRAWEALERGLPSGASLEPGRYRPEWRRYGGRAGVAAAERLFCASSRVILDFLARRAAGLELSKVEFALATGEMMLDALGLERAERDRIFRFDARQPLPPSENAPLESFRAALGPLIARAAEHPRGYWRADEPLGPLVDAWYAALAPLRPAVSEGLSRPLAALAHSYLHMHYNRLGLSQLHEHLLRRFRGELAAEPAQSLR